MSPLTRGSPRAPLRYLDAPSSSRASGRVLGIDANFSGCLYTSKSVLSPGSERIIFTIDVKIVKQCQIYKIFYHLNIVMTCSK